MNILFLSPSPITKLCRGGIERSTERCALEMISRGHAAFVFSWEKADASDTLSDAFPQKLFPRTMPHGAAENRELFAKTLREEKIDIVVFQCGGGWKFPFPREVRAAGVPVITVIRSVPNSYEARYKMKYSGLARWWNIATKRWRQARKYRFNYDCSARTVVLSNGLIPLLEAHLTRRQIAQKKTIAIGNFSPLKSYAGDLAEKRKELLFVGRMCFFEKRPDLLLQAWIKLQKRFPEWRLRFVGDGDYLPKLKALAGTLGAERVSFEGFQKPEPFYRDAAIFCMTSAYESFGNVLIEAAAFACVPVAFDAFPAAKDIISSGENGCLVPAFDTDKYAETLAALMSDDALRERLARNALAQIPEKFSPKKIGDEWEKLFEASLKKQ